jgi:type IX secretion system PorP/SprF family membrane protein
MKLKIFCFAFFVQIGAWAQGDPQFTHYISNQILYNPAYAGKGGNTQYALTHRSQYAGYLASFDKGGVAASQLLFASVPILDKKLGLAAAFFNDKIGPNATQNLDLSIAKKQNLGGGVFSLGAKIGLRRQSLDYSLLRYEDPNDPSIPTSSNGQTKLDFGAGLSLSNPLYNIGFSATHLLNPSFSYGTEAKNIVNRSYNLNLSFNVPISMALDLQPMAYIRKIKNQTYAEAGLLVNMNNRFQLGSSFRWQDAASALVGFTPAQNIKINYAADFVVFGTQAKSPISHEIQLLYTMPGLRIGRASIVRTPRYRF